jgi:hypothetical protein
LSSIVFKIKKEIEAQKLSIAEFERLVGVSQKSFRTWTDESLKVKNFLKACEILHLDAGKFLPSTLDTASEPVTEYGKKENCQEEIKFLKGIIKHHQDTINALNSAVTVLTNQLAPSEANKPVILKKK